MGGTLVIFEAGLRTASFLMTLGGGCYVCLSDATFVCRMLRLLSEATIVVGGYVCCRRLRLLSEATYVCCRRLRLLSEATFAVGGLWSRIMVQSP